MELSSLRGDGQRPCCQSSVEHLRRRRRAGFGPVIVLAAHGSWEAHRWRAMRCMAWTWIAHQAATPGEHRARGRPNRQPRRNGLAPGSKTLESTSFDRALPPSVNGGPVASRSSQVRRAVG